MRKFLTLIFVLLAQLAFGQDWIDTTFNIQTEFDIVYGTATNFAGATDTLGLDISYPENDVPPNCGRPLMVIVHGGAWFAGDKNGGYPRRLRQDFAKRGYVAASISYRLGQFHTNQFINCNVADWNCFNMTDSSEFYRANHRAIQDVNGAIRYLVNHTNDYQIDPNNVFVVGESAGGFIAMGVGFIDDESEVLDSLIGAYPDAPAPNTLYENACIRNYGLAPDIASMDLSRPALGNWQGTLNYPLLEEYTIRGVGNIYGGAFNNIFQSFMEPAPALYLYHQPCDLIVPYWYNKVLSGYNYCATQFPFSCGNIVNRPYVYGSRGIKELIDTMAANSVPTTAYYFDNSTNNYNCLQQLDPNLACHAIDAYWLRTTNMATYFAGLVDSCFVNAVSDFNLYEEGILQTLYPNPANDLMTIEFTTRVKQVDLEIVNVTGERMGRYHYTNLRKLSVDIAGLAKGVYYLVCFAEGNVEKRSFVKI